MKMLLFMAKNRKQNFSHSLRTEKDYNFFRNFLALKLNTEKKDMKILVVRILIWHFIFLTLEFYSSTRCLFRAQDQSTLYQYRDMGELIAP